jgi:hypothetical protein
MVADSDCSAAPSTGVPPARLPATAQDSWCRLRGEKGAWRVSLL